MKTSFYKNAFLTLLLFVGLSASSIIPAAQAGILFIDDFNVESYDINRAIWTTPVGNDAFFGRTAIRNPEIPDWEAEYMSKTIAVGTSAIDPAVGVAKLALSTYNPTDPSHNTFWGSEMNTIDTFSPTDTMGISFEARVRAGVDNIPNGVVTSFFTFGKTGNNENKDELDAEFLSNLYNSQNPQVVLNHYTDQPPSEGSPVLIPTNIDFSDFNIFKINWTTDNLQWFINNELVYTLNNQIPTHPLSARLNIWVPDQDWLMAYSNEFMPVNAKNDNTDFYYEVDWVKVSSLEKGISAVPEPSSALLFLFSGILAVCRRRGG